ncbi:MAG: ATP-binding protein, partial [Bacteroidota bacterium]
KNVRIIKQDSKGILWMGAFGGGILKYEPNKNTNPEQANFTLYTQQEGLASNLITSIYEDSRGHIWFGTADAGVMRYDGTHFETFGPANGLSDDDVWSINQDANGTLWLAVDACLNRVDFDDAGQLLSVTPFCEFDGLSDVEFFANATLLDANGNMWWGTAEDVVHIPSAKLRVSDQVPVVLMDELVLNDQSIPFMQLDQTSATGPLRRIRFDSVPAFHNYPVNPKLPYTFNDLTFRFLVTQVPNPEQARFSFQLEGVSNNWSLPSTENKYAINNLAPGRYTFRVKAVGQNNKWSAPITYSFTILPPWWLTIWAWIGYLFLFVSLLGMLYRFFLNRQLEKAEAKRVKELNNLKTQLYTNITHEFRTPLTVIMGMNDSIKGNEKAKQLIQRNSQNLLRLINQLLDLSKVDAGQLEVDLIQGNIVHYIQYLTESFYSMAKEREVQLTFYSEEEEIWMDHDEVKIQHIIYNLLSNALKFTEPGGKVILHLKTIILSSLKGDGKQASAPFLLMNVKDTGTGIPEAQLPHIFDRFYQVDQTSTRKGEGTGIGLALTKELIDLIGGTISAESQVGKGTTFRVHLPITQNAPSTKDLLSSISRKEAPKINQETTTPILEENGWKAPFTNTEVLIIEDNQDVATYIQSILPKEYRSHHTKNGLVGIEKAFELIPDIVISDVMMPEKDGFEVCESLKKDPRTSHIPVILLTARATAKDRIQGLQYGADAYLTKPFDKQELLVRLQQLAENRKRIQQHILEQLKAVPSEGSKALDSEQQFIKELKELVTQSISDTEFGVPQLAEAVKLSHTQLYRKLKALTDQTPSQFIKTIRMNRAVNLLEHSQLNISEIADAIGFTDPNYFSRAFQQTYGLSPRDFRNRVKK